MLLCFSFSTKTILVTQQCFSSLWAAFSQHQGHLSLCPPVIRLGGCKMLGGNGTIQMTQITKRHIPCQIILWLVVKCRRAGLGNLATFHMVTGWVSAYLWEVVIDCVCITCLVLSSLIFPLLLLFKLFLSLPISFLALALPFLLPCYTGGQGGGE